MVFWCGNPDQAGSTSCPGEFTYPVLKYMHRTTGLICPYLLEAHPLHGFRQCRSIVTKSKEFSGRYYPVPRTRCRGPVQTGPGGPVRISLKIIPLFFTKQSLFNDLIHILHQRY